MSNNVVQRNSKKPLSIVPYGYSDGKPLHYDPKSQKYSVPVLSREQSMNFQIVPLNKVNRKPQLADVRGPKKPKNKSKKQGMVKQASSINVDRYLMSINSYLQTLLDPFTVHGIKCPDITTTASTTMEIVYRNVLTANAQNICGVIFGYGITGVLGSISDIGGLVPYNNGANPFCVGNILGTGATSGGLYTTVTGVANIQFPQCTSLASPIPSLFSNLRLVSMGASVQFMGNFNNSAGVVTIASEPRNTYRNLGISIGTPTISLAAVQQLRSATVSGVSEGFGGSAVYFPQDPQSMSYTSTTQNYGVSTDPQSALGGEIYIICSGIPVGQQFELTAVWNFEATPLTNQLDLISPSPSQSDPLALSLAMNKCADIFPVCDKPAELMDSSIKNEATNMSGNQHDPDAPNMVEGMFNTIFNGINSAGRIAKKFSPLIEAMLL